MQWWRRWHLIELRPVVSRHVVVELIVVIVVAAVITWWWGHAHIHIEAKRVVYRIKQIVKAPGLLHLLVFLLAVVGGLGQIDDLKIVILILDSVLDILSILQRYVLVDALDDDLHLPHINSAPLPLAEALHIVQDPVGIFGLFLPPSLLK